ncbi:MAG: hypothetical protein DWQ47_07100 [Acidobacteria bacterium]|mgnify:CR=1 FL=1|nr:MAG: hypothetical protein DWQ32_15200 [Acidobacteriota bacterium]REJ99307.1 MAG: hypothetical protein DWQ38_14775 [Acidobacteriota bacterium]REK15973.1 MAG: hypothetical protein DWQ43_02910 [Acidobacteriota bacterium]REK43654.1 MAG: hypothetical protein DWQ47_07100 [Acidobacteriota bacterium]
MANTKKFDTNPLDPTFPEKAREKEEKKEKRKRTAPLFTENGQTRQFAEPTVTEEQTRRFQDGEFGAYDPAFGNVSQEPSSIYKAEQDENRSLKIGNISLPENILTALPYIPFAYLGLVAGIIELFLIPRSEPKVRYHAAQGVAAHVAIWIVTAILGMVGFGSDIASTASWIFSLVTTIMLLVFAFKAWQGKPIHIQSVESLTDWLEEKIKPQK